MNKRLHSGIFPMAPKAMHQTTRRKSEGTGRKVEFHIFRYETGDPSEYGKDMQELLKGQHDVFSKMEAQKIAKKSIHERITRHDMSND